MLVFKVIEIILVITYGLLNIYAASIGVRGKETSVVANLIMMIGGVLIILCPILEIINNKNMIYLLGLGLIFIQGASINNDLRLWEEINYNHQILRGVIGAIIIIIYFKGF